MPTKLVGGLTDRDVKPRGLKDLEEDKYRVAAYFWKERVFEKVVVHVEQRAIEYVWKDTTACH